MNRILNWIPSHLHLVFGAVEILLGIFNMAVFQAGDLPDNFPNYMTSYSLADKLMGRYVKIVDEELAGIKGEKLAIINVRECDALWFSGDETAPLQGEAYMRENSDFFSGKQKYVNIECEVHPYFAFPTYIIDALFIILGQVIHLGPVALLYFVRIANLLLYIMCGILALKLLPHMMEFIYVLWLTPIGIQFGCSVSHEALWWPFVWLYIIYVISLSLKTRYLEKREILIMYIFSILIAPVKGIGIGFCALIFLIDTEKFVSFKKMRETLILCFAICLTVWLFYNLTSVNQQNLFYADAGGRYIEYSQSDAVYVSDLLHYPLHYLKVVIQTLFTYFIYFPECFSAGELFYSKVTMYGLLSMFLLSLHDDSENSIILQLNKRIFILVLYGFIYGLTCILTILSWVGKSSDLGAIKVQYVMPMLPLIGAMLKNGKFIYHTFPQS